MTRTQIINKFIVDNNYTNFLEIGTNNGVNYNGVICENKTSVDPEPQVVNYVPTCNIETSDSFFARNKKKFDIIFIDGLHEATQVAKDIQNALNCLSDGGTIVCHDMKPRSYEAQLVPRIQKVWNGDCWKAWLMFRASDSFLKMYVIDTDEGCGVIKRGGQRLIEEWDMDYADFVDNQKELLNLISINEFKAL
jgi:hypothetical protein